MKSYQFTIARIMLVMAISACIFGWMYSIGVFTPEAHEAFWAGYATGELDWFDSRVLSADRLWSESRLGWVFNAGRAWFAASSAAVLVLLAVWYGIVPLLLIVSLLTAIFYREDN